MQKIEGERRWQRSRATRARARLAQRAVARHPVRLSRKSGAQGAVTPARVCNNVSRWRVDAMVIKMRAAPPHGTAKLRLDLIT